MIKTCPEEEVLLKCNEKPRGNSAVQKVNKEGERQGVRKPCRIGKIEAQATF